jgi:hypothetical protein
MSSNNVKTDKSFDFRRRRRKGKKAHRLNQNKIIRNNRYFIFYDTETREESGGFREIGGIERELKKQTLKLGEAIFWKRKEREYKEVIERLSFTKAKEYWSWVFSLIEKYDIKKLWVYAHNQDFDFKVVDSLNYLLKNGWSFGFWTVKNSSFILKFNKSKDGIKRSIVFLDTMNYVRSSLKDLGDSIGLKKLDVDFNNVSNKDLRIYCRRDVEIIFKFVKEFIEFLKDNNLGSLKYTIAGTSLNVFKHKFLNNRKVLIHNHKKAIELERDSYKGGRTECFYLGNIENVYNLDVNSMYPFMMKECRVPIKLIGYSNKEKSGKDFIKFYENAKKYGYLVIADIDFNLPDGYNDIGIKALIDKKPSLIFPIGYIRSALTSLELDYVLNYGNIIKVHRIALYEGDYLFKDFVDYFYEARRRYKKNYNSAYSMMVKLILNSLYGKFGQKNPITRSLKFDDNFKIDHKEIYDIDKDGKEIKTEVYRIGSEGLYETGEYEEARDSFVAIPSFISAYARLYLSKIIRIAERSNVFYTDTDSIFTNLDGIQRCKYAGLLGDQIGQLKEDEYGNVELKGCKDYIFNNKRKIKGVKKDAIELDLDSGIYEQERFIRLKTALKYGLIKDQYVYTDEKILNRDYKKGSVDVLNSKNELKIITVKPYFVEQGRLLTQIEDGAEV